MRLIVLVEDLLAIGWPEAASINYLIKNDQLWWLQMKMLESLLE